MAILTDGDIKREMFSYIGGAHLRIEPYDPKYLSPASYDFHLHGDILVPKIPTGPVPIVDPDATDGKEFWAAATLPMVLMPGQVILGRSIEQFSFPRDIVGRIEGVSTVGRWFIQVHITAGFFDPGWPLGTATLEIKNQGPFRVRLVPEMRIGQMAFERTESPSEQTYATRKHRYFGQVDPTAPRPAPTGAHGARTDHSSDGPQ